MELLFNSCKIDITPQEAVPLSGFAERSGVYDSIHDKLEINLAAIKQGTQTILLYSIDTLFAPLEFEELIAKEFNIPVECIWVMATHTHFAPSLDKDKPGLGALDKQYYEVVKSKLKLLTTQVLEGSYKKVRVEYGSSISQLNVNRRKKLWRPKQGFGLYRKVLLYPDYYGVKEPTIHTVKFINEKGTVESVFWNYACHPVGFPQRNNVSADFIGYIRDKLRKTYNDEELPVVFSIGFAGNLKPDVSVVTNTRWYDELRYKFQLGPKYTRFPSMEYYTKWNELLWQDVKESMSDSTYGEASSITVSQTELPLSDVIGSNNTTPIRFKKLTIFGKEFVGISAEVFAEYKDIVTEAIGNNTINIGCLAGTNIYLPTDKNVKEGGYEVDMFQSRFGIEGKFKNNIDEKIRQALNKL